jgi:hypothetical protein
VSALLLAVKCVAAKRVNRCHVTSSDCATLQVKLKMQVDEEADYKHLPLQKA